MAPLPDPAAMASWDRKVYTTKVRIDEALPSLRPGMTARAEIRVSELNNVLALPNQAVVRLDGKNQVAIQRSDGGFEWRVVALGASSDAMTEVMSGVKIGDSVALKPVELLTEAQKKQFAASSAVPTGQPGENPDRGQRPRRR